MEYGNCAECRIAGPPLFGLYPNGLYPNGLFMIGLSPFGLPMTFGLSLLDYFRLQGRSDYKDIWTIAIWTIGVWTILDYRDVWTTRTFGLPLFGLLGQTD